MKMLPTKSMRESTSTRTTSKLITTLMTTKRSLTSPRPIKRESTQMRCIKMGMTDKTTPSREMTSRPIKRGSTPIKEEMTKEMSIITPFREITSTRAMTSTTVGRVREMTKTIPTTEMVSERRVLDGVTLRRPSSKQKKGMSTTMKTRTSVPQEEEEEQNIMKEPEISGVLAWATVTTLALIVVAIKNLLKKVVDVIVPGDTKFHKIMTPNHHHSLPLLLHKVVWKCYDFTPHLHKPRTQNHQYQLQIPLLEQQQHLILP
uniref:Uncharacterized protein LOC111113604 n=1 Tax=Crassostrea virginica TaxID=6565 RepID=A0A8B8BXM8_CRAVI|nr:uncharacterized protein LOC111113604 [Crassostrea virginica]